MATLLQAHTSLTNGQRRQMVEQINEYGNYDFWNDYAEFLTETYDNVQTAWDHYRDAVVSYNRITYQ